MMKRVLIAVDETESSDRALRYAGAVLGHIPGVEVTLFHVLEPVPHHLYEHGGSESPAIQSRLGEELRRQREAWFEAEERREYPIVARARQILAETGFPAERIALKLGRQHEVRNAILDEARAGGFDTVVVGTHGRTPGIKGLLGATGKEPLPSRLAGIALWIVG